MVSNIIIQDKHGEDGLNNGAMKADRRDTRSHERTHTLTHTGEKTKMKMKMNARWETAFSSCSVVP